MLEEIIQVQKVYILRLVITRYREYLEAEVVAEVEAPQILVMLLTLVLMTLSEDILL